MQWISVPQTVFYSYKGTESIHWSGRLSNDQVVSVLLWLSALDENIIKNVTWQEYTFLKKVIASIVVSTIQMYVNTGLAFLKFVLSFYHLTYESGISHEQLANIQW